jgi:hypothetical protein
MPERRGKGAKALVLNPLVLSIAGVTGIAIAKRVKEGPPPSVRGFVISNYRDRLAQGTTQTFKTNAPNRRRVEWDTSDPNIATVDPDTGDVTGVAPGQVTIIAKSGSSEAKAGLTIE